MTISADIGNLNQPLIRDPQYIKDADYVVMESTYGDRSHGEVPDYVKELSGIIQKTFDRGGNVVIPSPPLACSRRSSVMEILECHRTLPASTSARALLNKSIGTLPFQ